MEFRASQEEVKQEEPMSALQAVQVPSSPGQMDMDTNAFKDITPLLKRGPGRKKKEESTNM